MSAAKENPCRKFQANIFNKSKCQNCFKPRESHLLNDEDLTQAKPIYGGWLLLAPDGTDFDNPVHRSRKWQRRFFILYEHGLLRYALDEMPTTLPQGTINMNQCTDVVDGEGRTGQKFSLCILTPEKEHFIRAETKEIISGWLEMLTVYPRTNKQNQKKKRKVEPPTPQEPGPAKMAVTSSSSSIPSAEKVPTTKSTLWQEEMRAKDQPDGSSPSPAQSPSQGQPPAASTLREPGLEGRDEESTTSGDRVDCGRKVRVESGYFSLEKTKQDVKAEEQQLPPPLSPPSPGAPTNRRSQVIEKFEALDTEKAEHMETNLSTGPSASSDTRQGRSEKRAFPRKRDLPSEAPLPDASASPLSPHRRAKSLDRRSTESSLTPDLLNFKKGWLTKQYEDGQWKKHWFVLADQSLRFYRDSVAEEAADLDGEIDLSTCCNVTEYPVQRNYGFQIHTKEGAFTLSAMTSGIRRNWIQTIMKHVHPTSAPDVTSSLPQVKARSSSPSETRPLEKQDGELGEPDPEQRRSRARERRREGRSKTFDWAEFRPIQQALAQERAGGPRAEVEPGELERERARRREERRKRFGTPDVEGPSADDVALRMEVDRGMGPPTAAELRTQNVHVEIEQRWHQVETTPLREEKQVPIAPLHLSSEDGSDRLSTPELTSLLEKELEQSQKEASDLLEQNRLLQDQLRVALGREQSAREGYVLQATCERGFAAMEETHQKKIEDLQRQHQRELEKLREEKDRLLAEETAATISAIEAMKNAHREEMERELEKSQRSQISSVNADVEALRRQYLEELQSVQRELEVLSEQYSQKCLENAHLAQALEAERQALRQCQRENQELNAHNQELNNRLAAEISRLRTLLTGDAGGEAAGSPLTQGKDAYELEVLLRVKESEIQYLKQEISSLKDELQTALRDKKYASDKYKDIYTELSIVRAKADCDVSRLKEQLKAATEALGEKSPENPPVSGYDIMKSKSNPDFLKTDRSCVGRQLRGLRSKSVIEQVSWDN
ncbi:myosin phosphatase Rho-interacting protein isoform X8 [Bos indicus x Bos taurus]|uniref:Myosin phosphatase Rho-interacting protein n=1 Tax=Bos taurus TaxID=9913 RepID=A7Z032_BOVIN|nr:myosin phosphatase Rho-interacting protein [Bos taurus]XP_027372643.1 myosin phosphatase Rho-interacting protein isoform X8 [Bos indicus x Bos taurus]XP_027372644.1 myosin phosphatase Rho-interacting protein isoform X8 [Bos indicus x Bos taurus]AAI53231.1 M-RIP protein [Bos taurus]DAA18709.1 TPA: myosin phosphatase-Rho interacting protein [Bos taurus]